MLQSPFLPEPKSPRVVSRTFPATQGSAYNSQTPLKLRLEPLRVAMPIRPEPSAPGLFLEFISQQRFRLEHPNAPGFLLKPSRASMLPLTKQGMKHYRKNVKGARNLRARIDA